MTFVALGAVLGVGTIVAVLYNGLVSARQRVREGWSAVDVQLQRRASLIPNLVEVVKGYATFERETLAQIVEARSVLSGAPTPADAARANSNLTEALHHLFVLAEAYPDLKASERFAALQLDLADTENKIAFARNYYNGAVEAYNIRVESIPGLLVARAFGFSSAEFFAADAPARGVPAVA